MLLRQSHRPASCAAFALIVMLNDPDSLAFIWAQETALFDRKAERRRRLKELLLIALVFLVKSLEESWSSEKSDSEKTWVWEASIERLYFWTFSWTVVTELTNHQLSFCDFTRSLYYLSVFSVDSKELQAKADSASVYHRFDRIPIGAWVWPFRQFFKNCLCIVAITT